MRQIKIESDGWCRCGKCGHKLFRLKDPDMKIVLHIAELEIKCHSCKSINTINFIKEEKE